MAAVSFDIESKICTLALNRPEKKNAFTNDMYSTLTDIVKGPAQSEDVSVLLITGGDNFSAGNDLADFMAHPPRDETAPVFEFMMALAQYPLPVVAAVEGVAIGIGTTLLLHCEFAYATEATVFSMPFINLALTPEFCSSQILPLRAGYQRAAELLLLGEQFNAETALQAGIISKICEQGAVETNAYATAEKLASKHKSVLIKTKELLKREPESVCNRIRYESNIFMDAVNAPAAQAAFKSFLKR